MKCFAAFSIIAALAAFLIWGVYELVAHGRLGEVIAILVMSAFVTGASIAVVWATSTAIDCWSNR